MTENPEYRARGNFEKSARGFEPVAVQNYRNFSSVQMCETQHSSWSAAAEVCSDF
jgi:hypothetical protein